MYVIHNNVTGLFLGYYEGNTEIEAYNDMLIDVGYLIVNNIPSEIDVIEVKRIKLTKVMNQHVMVYNNDGDGYWSDGPENTDPENSDCYCPIKYL